ncbi:Nitrogen permease regulator 2 [Mactra antiquata]
MMGKLHVVRVISLWLWCQMCLDIGFCIKDYKINIIVIAPWNDVYSFSQRRIMPALCVAKDKMESSPFEFNIEPLDSKFPDEISMWRDARHFIYNKSANVILGPVHKYALELLARVSSQKDIVIMSPGGFGVNLGVNKTTDPKFKSLIRVGTTMQKLINFTQILLDRYNYKLYKFISEKHDSDMYFCLEFDRAVQYLMNVEKSRRNNTIMFDRYLYPRKATAEHILKHEVGSNFSVVVLCASADSVREIMIKAHELNFDNGEYVFFNIDLFSSKNESKKPWFREDDTEERNKKARKAYEALMTVTLRKPTSPEYKNFSNEVKRRAKHYYENFTYGEEEVNSFVGAFHDAVILYALALNETLEANQSITNGTEITRRMWNRTFPGITGNVSIDDNGDRNADYSLLDMDPDTGEFEVVANYFGNTKTYEQVPGKQIRWAGNYEHAPPDTPKCGFDNSKCPPKEPFPDYGYVIIILCTLLLIVLIAAGFIYRHVKLEAELAEMNWRVRWEDIILGTFEGERKMKKQAASNLSLARTEDTSVEGTLLIERAHPATNNLNCTWCKCGQCDVTERNRRVCCRHIEKLEERLEDVLQSDRCITSTKDFQDVVLNPQVLLTVYIHVMLARKQRGNAPYQLTPYKCRLMATRQFLCWLHSGETLERQTKWAIPACVIRAIKLMFPDIGAEVTSGDDACSLTLEDILPTENHSSV